MDVNEPLHIFISYSHVDRSHLNDFTKHLISLRRNGVIKDWTDKELIAGDKLDEEIKDNLLSANIVVFLISVEFLNSYYAYEIELRETLERIKSNDPLRIVPVIIDYCDWQSSLIKDFLVTPEDGKPITSWENTNKAWLSVINEIKRVVEKMREQKKVS
jgi:hypothetical protein